MQIVITGADGFIARNLRVHLGERDFSDVTCITRGIEPGALSRALAEADFVFHLAGVNRPRDVREFERGNVDFTRMLCELLAEAGRATPVAFASSTQAELDNPYGLSKRRAEEVLLAHSRNTGAPVYLFRLTNVFGKWSRPGYNSAVATFCHNIAKGLPITINDPASPLRLVHVDDVVAALLSLLETPAPPAGFAEAGPVHETTVGEVVRMLRGFAESRRSLVVDRVGTGLTRALYSTYVSYLLPESFSYTVPSYGDARGTFVEMLKTPDCGQFSYFTARPGVTRGEHYHHSKTEKFLVISGTARFGFRHIITGHTVDLEVCGGQARIVETVPGWTHDITNVGDTDLVVMLWANEVFDKQRPDTVPMKVRQ